jgi:DNA polymerase III alpha subunit
MKEAGEEPSIIRYALEHNADELKEWVVMKDDGELEGPYAPYFAQAIRLEGTKRNISRHASGVLLANQPLGELCPLLWDEGINGYKAGMEYPDLEEMGQAKFDILGTAVLDKRVGIENLLLFGEVEPEEIPMAFPAPPDRDDSSGLVG